MASVRAAGLSPEGRCKRLDLKPGDHVLEIGCGTGRNLPYLRDAVGPQGRVYGVDISAGMLERAQTLRDRHHGTMSNSIKRTPSIISRRSRSMA